MHLHPFGVGSFETDCSGQHESALRAACMSHVESHDAATHDDMGIAGVDRLSTTMTAPSRRVRSRAEQRRDMDAS